MADALEQRALRLEHKMTAKARLGADMAERLSPYLLAGYARDGRVASSVLRAVPYSTAVIFVLCWARGSLNLYCFVD